MAKNGVITAIMVKVTRRYQKGTMQRAKSICRETRCNALVPSPGYCDAHSYIAKDRFKNLKRAPGSRDFYGSHKWRKTSIAYRKANPLCEEHLASKRVIRGELVDHIIERPELIAKGLDPHDFDYLQTLCMQCHNKKLRKKAESTHHGIRAI